MQRPLPWFLLVVIAIAWGAREAVREDPESASPTSDSGQEAASAGDSTPKPKPVNVVALQPFSVAEPEVVFDEEVEEPVTEEPVIKDSEVSDHNDTDDNEEWEESKGEEDALSDKPFDGTRTNDAIGLGGGAAGHDNRGRRMLGGRPGGRRSEPRLKPHVYDRRWHRHDETYARIDESPFKTSRTNPLSTFSIDVDTASYANVRRHLQDRQLPPRDAVRIEELINWFTYHLPEPEGDEAFSRTVEVADCPWEPRNRVIRIGLQGRSPKDKARKPSNLVFLLDVSGSMGDPEKLPLLKTCLRGLTSNLTENDRISIVTYASAASIALESMRGHHTAAIRSIIDNLDAGGSTNGEGGLHLAYQLAKKNFIENGVNRVILATDGDFNVGVSDTDELKKIIKGKAKTGVFLSCLGFGTGNYRDDVMESLADNGNGHYAYIDSLKEGVKVLGKELLANLETIAKDVKIQVEFNPQNVQAWRLIGYENRTLKARDFNDDKLDAGEIGAGHSVTALYEIVPVGKPTGPGIDGLRYAPKAPATTSDDPHARELMTLKVRYKRPQGTESTKLVSHIRDTSKPFDEASSDFRFACSVALFGMALRDSNLRGEMSHAVALDMASTALADDPDGQRSSFLDLVRTAQALTRRSN